MAPGLNEEAAQDHGGLQCGSIRQASAAIAIGHDHQKSRQALGSPRGRTHAGGDEPVLTIIVTSPGEPDEILELRGIEPLAPRRRPWLRRGLKDVR